MAAIGHGDWHWRPPETKCNNYVINRLRFCTNKSPLLRRHDERFFRYLARHMATLVADRTLDKYAQEDYFPGASK